MATLDFALMASTSGRWHRGRGIHDSDDFCAAETLDGYKTWGIIADPRAWKGIEDGVAKITHGLQFMGFGPAWATQIATEAVTDYYAERGRKLRRLLAIRRGGSTYFALKAARRAAAIADSLNI